MESIIRLTAYLTGVNIHMLWNALRAVLRGIGLAVYGLDLIAWLCEQTANLLRAVAALLQFSLV